CVVPAAGTSRHCWSNSAASSGINAARTSAGVASANDNSRRLDPGPGVAAVVTPRHDSRHHPAGGLGRRHWRVSSRTADVQDELAVVHRHQVGADWGFAGSAVAVDQSERVVVQRADPLLAVDEAIGQRAAAVWAAPRHRAHLTVTRPEYRHQLVTDGERAALTQGNLLSRAEPA